MVPETEMFFTEINFSDSDISSSAESQRLLQELEETNRNLKRIIHHYESRSKPSSAIFSSLKRFLHRYRHFLLAFPNLLATFLWLVMLIYFMAWYLNLPRDDLGRHPQICEDFSLWPYISCIGARRLPIFRGVCVTMAILITSSFLMICYLGNEIEPGRWLRRISALFAVISSSALVALSFESTDSAPTAHLICTSIQIFCMGNTKFFDWTCNSTIRRSFGKRMGNMYRIRPLEVSRWLKTCVAAFAAVPAMVTCMGIYDCTDTKDINDPTSTCNKIVALSAVSEWLLSIGWVMYMSTISYDLYHIELVINLLHEGNPKRVDSSVLDKDGSLQLLLPDNRDEAS